ncbi:MAG: hypothetical protein FD149_826 [Rhodospirillaceae bacterium]|nr:MAG: hypothetical protein FD149_826 [Rhodospirillaceae bacterium]
MSESSDGSVPRKVPQSTRRNNHPISRTQRHGLTAIGVALTRTAQPFFKRYGFDETMLLTQWPAIIGPELAAICLPTRLVFHRGTRHDGILTVRVPGGGFAVEIQHRAPFLIERIKTYFGYAVVGQIRIRQGPLPHWPRHACASEPATLPLEEEHALMNALTAVKDDSLRAALTRLGQAVLSPLHSSCPERTKERTSAVTSGSTPNQAVNPGRA